MHCPRCRQPMGARHEGLLEDILVHVCEPCDALWIPPESLDRLDDNIFVDATRIEWTETGEDAGLACPRCFGRYRQAPPFLRQVALPAAPPIVADRCTACGAFLLSPATLERLRGYVAGRS